MTAVVSGFDPSYLENNTLRLFVRCHKFLKNNGLIYEELANSQKFALDQLTFPLDLSTTISNYGDNLDDSLISEMIKI